MHTSIILVSVAVLALTVSGSMAQSMHAFYGNVSEEQLWDVAKAIASDQGLFEGVDGCSDAADRTWCRVKTAAATSAAQALLTGCVGGALQPFVQDLTSPLANFLPSNSGQADNDNHDKLVAERLATVRMQTMATAWMVALLTKHYASESAASDVCSAQAKHAAGLLQAVLPPQQPRPFTRTSEAFFLAMPNARPLLVNGNDAIVDGYRRALNLQAADGTIDLQRLPKGFEAHIRAIAQPTVWGAFEQASLWSLTTEHSRRTILAILAANREHVGRLVASLPSRATSPPPQARLPPPPSTTAPTPPARPPGQELPEALQQQLPPPPPPLTGVPYKAISPAPSRVPVEAATVMQAPKALAINAALPKSVQHRSTPLTTHEVATLKEDTSQKLTQIWRVHGCSMLNRGGVRSCHGYRAKAAAALAVALVSASDSSSPSSTETPLQIRRTTNLKAVLPLLLQLHTLAGNLADSADKSTTIPNGFQHDTLATVIALMRAVWADTLLLRHDQPEDDSDYEKGVELVAMLVLSVAGHEPPKAIHGALRRLLHLPDWLRMPHLKEKVLDRRLKDVEQQCESLAQLWTLRDNSEIQSNSSLTNNPKLYATWTKMLLSDGVMMRRFRLLIHVWSTTSPMGDHVASLLKTIGRKFQNISTMPVAGSTSSLTREEITNLEANTSANLAKIWRVHGCSMLNRSGVESCHGYRAKAAAALALILKGAESATENDAASTRLMGRLSGLAEVASQHGILPRHFQRDTLLITITLMRALWAEMLRRQQSGPVEDDTYLSDLERIATLVLAVVGHEPPKALAGSIQRLLQLPESLWMPVLPAAMQAQCFKGLEERCVSLAGVLRGNNPQEDGAEDSEWHNAWVTALCSGDNETVKRCRLLVHALSTTNPDRESVADIHDGIDSKLRKLKIVT